MALHPKYDLTLEQAAKLLARGRPLARFEAAQIVGVVGELAGIPLLRYLVSPLVAFDSPAVVEQMTAALQPLASRVYATACDILSDADPDAFLDVMADVSRARNGGIVE
jgi:hypothetical protein